MKEKPFFLIDLPQSASEDDDSEAEDELLDYQEQTIREGGFDFETEDSEWKYMETKDIKY